MKGRWKLRESRISCCGLLEVGHLELPPLLRFFWQSPRRPILLLQRPSARFLALHWTWDWLPLLEDPAGIGVLYNRRHAVRYDGAETTRSRTESDLYYGLQARYSATGYPKQGEAVVLRGLYGFSSRYSWTPETHLPASAGFFILTQHQLRFTVFHEDPYGLTPALSWTNPNTGRTLYLFNFKKETKE